MTYDQLEHYCRRIIGLHPDSTESPLECIKYLRDHHDSSRAILAEMLARELAKYVAEHRVTT